MPLVRRTSSRARSRPYFFWTTGLILIGICSINVRFTKSSVDEGVMTFVISCGQGETDAVEEMIPLLKSIIVLTATERVRFEFLTDGHGNKKIRNYFEPPMLFGKEIEVRINVMNMTKVLSRAKTLDFQPRHHSGLWGLSKLFTPWILEDISKGIVLDTDMIFIQNPTFLWKEFGKDSTRSWIYKMPMMSHDSSNNICSCVNMIDMAMARKERIFPRVIKDVIKKSPYLIQAQAVGDQAVYFEMNKHTNYLRKLPDMWNVDKCHKYNQIWRNGKKSDQIVALLHRNCLAHGLGKNIYQTRDEVSTYFDFWKSYRWEWIASQIAGFRANVTTRYETG